MSYNLDNFKYINGKNKTAKYGDMYFNVTMINNEVYNNSNPFFTFNNTRFFIDGIEPILTIYNGPAKVITNQYTFRNSINGSNKFILNVPINYPGPDNEQFDTTENVDLFVTNMNDVVTFRKCHISDMQILITNDILHIFMLTDILSSYVPSGKERTNSRLGHHGKVIIYQQHAITNSGTTINTTPTKFSIFPFEYTTCTSGSLKYGKFINKTFSTSDWNMNNKSIYYNDIFVTDFYCGIITEATDEIYCIFGTSKNTIEIYSCVTTDVNYTESTWKYTSSNIRNNKKFTTENVPYNIYSHYSDPNTFHIGWSYFDTNGDIKWTKINSSNRSNTLQKGNGMIVFNDYMNLIINDKIVRNEYNTSNNWNTYPLKDIIYNIPSIFTDNIIDGEFFKFGDFIKFNYKILPSLSISKYTSTNNYYNYFITYNNTKIMSSMIKRSNGDYFDCGFFDTTNYKLLATDGDYIFSC